MAQIKTKLIYEMKSDRSIGYLYLTNVNHKCPSPPQILEFLFLDLMTYQLANQSITGETKLFARLNY